jgi:tryptophan synthase beta chain
MHTLSHSFIPEPIHAGGEEKVILTGLCGHGHLDLASYEKYPSGDMVDYELPDEAIAEAIKTVPVR